MAKKRKKSVKEAVVSFRCPDKTLKGLDNYLEELRDEFPGGNWSRSSAALNAITLGLAAFEQKKKLREAALAKSNQRPPGDKS